MSTDPKEWTVLSMLKWGTAYFKKKQIPDPRHSIEWLLADVLDIKRLDLYINFDRPLSASDLETIRPLIKRRARHEPLQYITGVSEFINARITVNADVLIPRIETEQLVEIILDDFSNKKALDVLDIGTGSGCIPITLKMERPAWTLSGLDISASALDTARKNAEANNANIYFIQGDITKPAQLSFKDTFDVIVSNPPYVLPGEKKTLEPQVREYEPHLALFCDNLKNMYQNIEHFSARHLNPKGTLYVEINERYSDRIMSVFAAKNWQTSLLKDYTKKPRFIKAQLQH